ncbi:hypothetical protein GCM10009841_07260 [Microlunatus panaciterrae]|uniref:Uncharacterized protein n=1 Tax=Microlunatus panaciterrae TaxID=400768 RepID=A0ABS2RHZ8_9ACTN|nr:hypothetical protein [Microlunatus panaciterrae]MBM7798620.1 hypothetical protein [Microlunatus panaciterrae]
MKLEAVADELYGAAPEEFVELRKQRIAEAREAKDRSLVKAIGALRRPTRSAWLVNLLAREAAEELNELLDLGAALGEAQRRLSGPDLRRLSNQRRAAVEGLVRLAVEIAGRHGHVASDATRQEVSQTLQAALADPDVGELVRTGRVVQAASYGGFGPTDFLSLVPPTPEAEPPEAARAGDQPVAAADDGALRAARSAVTEAEQSYQAAAREAARSSTASEKATATADHLAEEVEKLRDRLRAAEQEEKAAREAARFARKEHQQLQREADQAERALVRARSAMAELN